MEKKILIKQKAVISVHMYILFLKYNKRAKYALVSARQKAWCSLTKAMAWPPGQLRLLPLGRTLTKTLTHQETCP